MVVNEHVTNVALVKDMLKILRTAYTVIHG